LPELEAIRAEFEPQGIRFIAVSLDSNADLVRRTAEKLGIHLALAVPQSEVLGPLGVKGIPSTLFIRADGTIVAAAMGERSRKFLADRTRELLR
jgi:hypothetical protein